MSPTSAPSRHVLLLRKCTHAFVSAAGKKGPKVVGGVCVTNDGRDDDYDDAKHAKNESGGDATHDAHFSPKRTHGSRGSCSADILFLKHACSTLRQSSNPVCVIHIFWPLLPIPFVHLSVLLFLAQVAFNGVEPHADFLDRLSEELRNLGVHRLHLGRDFPDDRGGVLDLLNLEIGLTS